MDDISSIIGLLISLHVGVRKYNVDWWNVCGYYVFMWNYQKKENTQSDIVID